ncbi:MAG TPA: hypothetical protein VGL39_27680 [Jatrophihabitantaceae bacterium]|jgi:hypothetical protein
MTWDALAAAARAETAAVYSRPCPESRSGDARRILSTAKANELAVRRLVKDMETQIEQGDLADEVAHLKAMGLPVLEIAERLDVTVAEVRKAGAA